MPPPGAWEFEEDEWYSDHIDGARHVRPRRLSRPRFLDPNTSSVHLHRTRSQGHSPAPHISIYNTVDDHQRVSQALPSPRGSPRGRTTRLADELDDLETLEQLRRARSRSRGPLFHEHDSSYERMQLELANERLRERDRERHDEDLKDRIRQEYEYKKEKERRKREEKEREDEDDRKRIITEENARLDKARRDAEDMKERARAQWEREEREAKEKRQRAVDEWELKRRREIAEEEAEYKRIIADHEAKKIADEKKAKDEREAWRLKLQLEEEARKEKEKKEYEEFLLKQREKEDEEKRKKKAEEEALAEAMTKRLMLAGFQNNQIQAIIKTDVEHPPPPPGATPGHPVVWQGGHGHQPTYIKVHRDHLSIDTLSYFDIPWEYDRVRRLPISFLIPIN